MNLDYTMKLFGEGGTMRALKVGDIVAINPEPCRDNDKAMDNFEYISNHFKGITENTLFVILAVEDKMVDVKVYGREDSRTDSMFASRFTLNRYNKPFDEGLFAL